LEFNSTTHIIDFLVDPFLDIQEPFPDAINSLVLSVSINVTCHISSHDWTGTLLCNFGYIDSNTTSVYHRTSYGENQAGFFFRNMNMTEICFTLSYEANYSIDMIYSRPPKTYAWATVRSFLTTEGIILVGVVLFTSVLIYASMKMVKE
jgi:hypothetical protein